MALVIEKNPCINFMKISFRINLLKNDFNSHEKSYEIFFTRTPHYKMLSLVEWHYAKKVIFSKSALNVLYFASGGVPRLINILAHKALLAAYGKSAKKVERQHMVRAVLDTAESKKWGRWLAKRDYWLWPLLAASAAVALSVTPALGGSL